MKMSKTSHSKELENRLVEMRKDPVAYYARVRVEEARKIRVDRGLRGIFARHRTA